MKRGSKQRNLFATSLLVLCAAALLYAGDPWEKPPEQWSLTEAYRILQDSPWRPADTAVELSLERRNLDPLTHRMVKRPLGEPGATVSTAQFGKKPSSDIPVLWWSARAVRLAQLRVRELRGPAVPRKPLRAEHLADIVIVVEGSEPLRILRDASENLKDTVYLELPDGLALDATDIEFHEGQEAGDDFSAFHFPRTIDGRPTLTPGTGLVIFHCKATAKTEATGRPNMLQIRAPFEPRKMRFLNQPDL